MEGREASSEGREVRGEELYNAGGYVAVKSYKELIVWQKSMDLVENLYLETNRYPKSELYGLTSQIRRAGVSVVANIAEGYSRRSTKEYRQFLYMAYASASEVEALLLLSFRLDYLTDSNMNDLVGAVDEVQRMIRGIINKLK